MAKNDRRARYTRQVIKNTLLDMLYTTPVDQITVKALCEMAEINRATFYNHYETLSTLMDELEYETYKLFVEMLKHALYDESYIPILLSMILQHLKNHPNIRELFLSKATAGRGLTRLLDELYSQDLLAIGKNDILSQKQAQWTLTYISSGAREVIRHWFSNGMQDENALLDMLSRLIQTGLHAFLQK